MPTSFFERSAEVAMAHAAAAASATGETEDTQEQGATPCASQRAIRQLPIIVVSSEDLVDENNRECCICFEQHNIGDKVIRLPCAHIYHSSCITNWLSRHCTCPVCRYELPTDDLAYEEKRKNRMSRRKPRFAQYELERMAMKELINLCKRLKLNSALVGGTEKKEVIQAILDSGKIDIIVAPEPVEYESICVLRSMGVGKLKKAMREAGVFFDAKDVVEKEDMVQIFVNSGRIVLMQREKENLDSYGYNTYDHRDDNLKDKIMDDGIDPNQGKVKYNDYGRNSPQHIKCDSSEDDGSDPKRARVNSKDLYGEDKLDSKTQSSEPVNILEDTVQEKLTPGDENMDSVSQNVIDNSTNIEVVDLSSVISSPQSENGSNLNFSDRSSPYNEYTNFSSENLRSEGLTCTSVADLRELAGELHIDISDCLEKKEMTDRILAAVSRSNT